MNHKELALMCSQEYSPDENADVDDFDIGGEGARCLIHHGAMGRPTVIVFRGTADVIGFFDDADMRLVPFDKNNDSVLVHEGFLREWEAVKKRVIRAVGRTKCIITGHSLGGGLATLAAIDIPCMELVTYGSPRVGNGEFVAMFNKLPLVSTRYVYHLDPVPLMPPKRLGYQPIPKLQWNDGELWQAAYDWSHVIQLGLHSLWSMATSLGDWRLFPRRFINTNHSIENYVAHL